jgi:hypothetical protein
LTQNAGSGSVLDPKHGEVAATYLKLDGFAQHHLVEGADEEPVQQLAMEDGHSSNSSLTYVGCSFNLSIPYIVKNSEAVLRIRISMFLGLLDLDPDPLVRGTDPAPDLVLDPSVIKQK